MFVTLLPYAKEKITEQQLFQFPWENDVKVQNDVVVDEDYLQRLKQSKNEWAEYDARNKKA